MDASFPNGVLQFNSTASFKSFYEKAEKDPEYVNRLTNGFKTFKVYIDNYNSSKSSSKSDGSGINSFHGGVMVGYVFK